MVLDMEMSKTYQYRKVMKPMLERKRRARINKCLDELKEIMVECLTQEGEHITRLEKADILELTVEHMKKLRAQKQLRINNNNNNNNQQQQQQQQQQTNNHQLDAVAKVSVAESFRAGYVHAANEVSKTLATVPGVSVDLGTQLMSHLGHRLNYLQVVVPTAIVTSTSSSSSSTSSSSISGKNSITTNLYPLSPSSPINCNKNIENIFFDQHHNQQHQQQQQQQQQQHQQSIQLQDPRIPVITPPPSECSSDRSSSPTPSDSGSVWRPW